MKQLCIKLSITLIIALCLIPLSAKKSSYTTLKPAHFKTQIEQTANPCIIDIRPAADYAVGHIAGAINMDSNDLHFISTLKHLYPETETIFVYCKLGKTAKPIAEKLATNGFRNVFSLKGGITAWGKKLPVAF